MYDVGVTDSTWLAVLLPLSTFALVEAEFQAEMVKSLAKGGWTYVVLPGSA